MKLQFFSGVDSYGENQIYLHTQIDFTFNGLSIQLIPHLLRYHQASLGYTYSHVQTELKPIVISSNLIKEMRELQLKSPDFLIKNYIFEIVAIFRQDKTKQKQISSFLNITSPWLQPQEAQAFPYGLSLNYQELQAQDLPKPRFEVKLLQIFDQEDLQTTYEQTQSLDFQITLPSQINQIKVQAEIEKLSFQLPSPQAKSQEDYQINWELKPSLAQILEQAEASTYRQDFPQYLINLVLEAKEQEETIHETHSFWLDNPKHKEKIKINKQLAQLLQDILNQDFPNHQGQIDQEADWFRFHIDNHAFQSGLKNGSVYVYVHFSKISYDIDFKKLKKEMTLFNKNLKHKLKELDNYFAIEAKIKFNKLKAANLSKLISEVLNLANNQDLQSFMSPYERV